MAPVEIAALILRTRIVDAQERGMPAVAAENLIRALATLNDLDVPGDLFR
jgi:hypothetical protein